MEINPIFYEKAFPSNDNFNYGMALIDYFACQLLQATMNVVYPEKHDEQNLETIRNCYRMAEMMMKVREEFLMKSVDTTEQKRGLQ